MDSAKRIENKLDKISDVQQEQAVTLARLTVSVEDHVKRTNMLEGKLEPITKHVAMVEGAIKLIGIAGLVAAIVEAIHTFFR